MVLNKTREGVPKIALFGMSLSGAFSEGAQALFNRLAEIKFPTPITAGSLSYLAARQRWVDWWMRIFQRNTFNVVAKSLASRIRIFNDFVPTALPMDYADKAADNAPFVRHSHSQALDSLDSEVEVEPQSSGDEHFSSDDVSGVQTLTVSSSEDDTEVQSSTLSSSEQSSNVPTLIVSPSDDDTEVPGTLLHTVVRGKGPKHCQQDETSTGMPTTPNDYIARRFFTIATAPTNADYAHRLKRPSFDTSIQKRKLAVI